MPIRHLTQQTTNKALATRQVSSQVPARPARMKPMPIPLGLAALWMAVVLAMPSAWAQSTDLSACMAELRPAARSGKVSDATWARHTAGLQADFSVIEKLNFQPEFRTAIWDYMSALVDEERVADGKARLTEHRQALERAEQRFGVDPATVVAVWGVESNFGQTFGKYPLVQALGTLSCHGRRQSYFRGEFLRRCAFCRRVTSHPSVWWVRGRGPLATPSSCPAPSSDWRWTLTATAAPT